MKRLLHEAFSKALWMKKVQEDFELRANVEANPASSPVDSVSPTK